VLEHPFFSAPKKTPGENVIRMLKGKVGWRELSTKVELRILFCMEACMDFSATHVFGDAPKRKEKIHTPKFSENKN